MARLRVRFGVVMDVDAHELGEAVEAARALQDLIRATAPVPVGFPEGLLIDHLTDADDSIR